CLNVRKVWQQADDRATFFQPNDLPFSIKLSKNHWRIVSCVHIRQLPCRLVILGVKECCISIFGRRLIHKLVYIPHHVCEVVRISHRLSAQASLQACHQQRGCDSFARHVAYRDSEHAIRELQKIVVVAADSKSGPAGSTIIEPGNRSELLREQTFLDLASDLDLTIEPLSLRDFGSDGDDQAAVLEREPGLGGDGLQQLEIGWRVRRLGLLWPKAYETG